MLSVWRCWGGAVRSHSFSAGRRCGPRYSVWPELGKRDPFVSRLLRLAALLVLAGPRDGQHTVGQREKTKMNVIRYSVSGMIQKKAMAAMSVVM